MKAKTDTQLFDAYIKSCNKGRSTIKCFCLFNISKQKRRYSTLGSITLFRINDVDYLFFFLLSPNPNNESTPAKPRSAAPANVKLELSFLPVCGKVAFLVTGAPLL